MGIESKELFELYLKLQATDGYFIELIEEDLERKQLVLGILSCSSSWDTLARKLEEQSSPFAKLSTNGQGSSEKFNLKVKT